jgi:hypothetical protein
MFLITPNMPDENNQIPKEGKSADGAILCSRFRVVNEVICSDKIVGAGLAQPVSAEAADAPGWSQALPGDGSRSGAPGPYQIVDG